MSLLKMKPIHQHFIAAIMLLLCAFQVSAQTPIDVTFTPATSTVAVGATVAIQMKVLNFKNVTSVQFPIVFNKDILQLVSVTGPHAQLVNFHVDFNDPDPNLALSPGKLAVSWSYNAGSQPNGATIPGTGTFFTLNFKALTNGVSTVNLAAAVQPLVEIQNTMGQPITVNFQNGAATITAGTGGPNPPVAAPIQGLHIIANTLQIPPGQVGCMPVTVNDFDDVVSFTYAINWDPLILEVVGSRDGRTNKLVPSDVQFGVFNNTGRLSQLWYTPTVPNTRADLSGIYDVCFKAKGAANSNTLVRPNGDGFGAAGSAELLQVKNNVVGNYWKDTTGIRDTIFIQASANPTNGIAYTGETDSTLQNAVGCVDVRVKSFTNSTYGEFALTYDSTKLEFKYFNLGANPLGLDTSSTAPNNIENFLKFYALPIVNNNGDEQTLRYAQFAYRNVNGLTLPDNTVAFSACFKAIGPVFSTNNVQISSYLDPGNVIVPIGASKKTVGAVPISYTSGSMYIKSATTLSATATVAQNVSCASGNNSSNGAINLSVVNCGGTATYSWSNGATTKDISSLTAGTYTVTVTCSTGGTATSSATVTGPSALNFPTANVTSITCNGGNNGAIAIAPIGGIMPYTYVWTGPAGFGSMNQNITNLIAGPYKVTITDANGCTISPTTVTPITVTSPGPIAVNSSTSTTLAVKCKGGSDGAITIPTPTGGTAPFTYAWSGPGGFSATTQNISGLKAGNYSVVITDSKGCTGSLASPLMISEPALAVTVSNPVASNIKCFGASDGAIQVNVSGGTSPYTAYAWKNVATNAIVSTLEDPTGLPQGTYILTATDAAQCTGTGAQVSIAAPSSALTVTESHTDAACAGMATGTITLSVSGGWNNPTFAWSPALPALGNQTGVLPGTYTATVTDANNCSVTIPVTVSSAAAITTTNIAVTNVKCFKEANGGIVLSLTGGGTNSGPYTVSWSPGGLSGQAIGGLAGDVYTPTVTNTNTGCTVVLPAITVTEPNAIQVDSVVTMQTGASNNGKIDLTNISGGTAGYQISWTGPNGFTSTQQVIDNLAPGNYVLNITDANLCTYTTTINVASENPLNTATIINVKNACDNDGCITVNISSIATATPFVLSWGGGTPTVTTDHNAVVCGLAPGVYNITLTDAAGHSFVLPAQNITQLAPANAGSNLVNPVGSNMGGSIILNSAGAPLTYLWNNGSTSAALIGLDSGTYIVTITNLVSLCQKVDTFHLVRQYAIVTANFAVNNSSCAGVPTGSINLNSLAGGNGTLTFSWSGPNGFTASTQNINNLAPGTYNLIITDQTPTTYTFSAQTVIATSNLAVTNVNETSFYNGFQVSAFTACDGAASVVIAGAAGTPGILWSNGITTVNNTTLCAGSYTVTVTDQNGCTAVWSDALTSPDALSVVPETVAPSCAGKCDGLAQLRVIGGLSPYKIRWALPANQFQLDELNNSFEYSTVNNLCGGTYSVTITDKNGATSVQSVVVATPTPITATFNQNTPSRFNSCDAETMINVIGGSNPIDYAWSGSNSHSGNEARADGLCAGEVVTFVIVDNRGCTATLRDTINYPEDGCLLGSPVITPGEKDGKNDVLFITCAETVNNKVEIFNRWGQMVFSVVNYDNNGIVWEGETKNGAALPEGVYFYVMTYTDTQGVEQRIKGYVNLLR